MADLYKMFNVPRVNKTAQERRMIHLNALAAHYTAMSELFAHMDKFDAQMLHEMLAHHYASGNHLKALIDSLEQRVVPTGEY